MADAVEELARLRKLASWLEVAIASPCCASRTLGGEKAPVSADPAGLPPAEGEPRTLADGREASEAPKGEKLKLVSRPLHRDAGLR
jgi:hypothetical protein